MKPIPNQIQKKMMKKKEKKEGKKKENPIQTKTCTGTEPQRHFQIRNRN
jgi:hypothetical protein